jgi:hypothetical protein
LGKLTSSREKVRQTASTAIQFGDQNVDVSPGWFLRGARVPCSTDYGRACISDQWAGFWELWSVK